MVESSPRHIALEESDPLRLQHGEEGTLWLRNARSVLSKDTVYCRNVIGYPWVKMVFTVSPYEDDPMLNRRFLMSVAGGEEDVVTVITADMGRIEGEPQAVLLGRLGGIARRAATEIAGYDIWDYSGFSRKLLLERHGSRVREIHGKRQPKELVDGLEIYQMLVAHARPLDFGAELL